MFLRRGTAQRTRRTRSWKRTFVPRIASGKVDLASLFYTDERADPAESLAAHGWTTSSLRLRELAERYNRPVAPVAEPLAEMFDSTRYLTAIKPF